MENENVIVIIGIGILCLALIIIPGISMITSNVIGANITNDTAVAKVYVWNTDQNITMVVISPSPTIDLTAGGTTEVNCTAHVWDYNGWQDIKNVSASLYDINYGDGTTADNNYRYINTSCGNATTACTYVSANNASCTCSFDVRYYANNGTWQCNMTIKDRGGNATERFYYFNDSETSSSVTVNTVLGINAPNEIDYGNLSVTETSGQIPANVTNWGNVPINISVRGYGGTNESLPNVGNLSMICGYGNISMNYERYTALSGTSYDNMINLSNSSTQLTNFTLPVRTNDANYGNDTNTTYWRIQIPLTIGGYCNGTVIFSAIENS